MKLLFDLFVISIVPQVLSFTHAVSRSTTEHLALRARADGIDFHSIPGIDLNSVLQGISTTHRNAESTTSTIITNTSGFTSIIDVHAHCVPDWYRSIVPTTGGNPTPIWSLSSHLAFMSTQSISHAVLAFSAPGANVYPGNKPATIALARLINEQTAAYIQAHPGKFTFYAAVPLPYTQSAIVEAEYALDKLGAAGIALYSNFEGHYLGDASFSPFFSAINARGKKQIIYIHPTTPYLRINGSLIEANPTHIPTGNIEFYFETARTISDLAISQTILNFTNINYIIPHVGGAFPAVIDRLLRSYPALYNSTLSALQSRFWWDSAGPTYAHQVGSLLAYGVPSTQLLFGTDYPYAPGFTYAAALMDVEKSKFVTDGEREDIFRRNAEELFGGKLAR